jgi:hypothetical protein
MTANSSGQKREYLLYVPRSYGSTKTTNEESLLCVSDGRFS